MTGLIHPRETGFRARLCLYALVLGMAAGMAFAQQRSPEAANTNPKHFNFKVIASAAGLVSLNHDDARAAIKTWFELMAKQSGLFADSSVDVLNTHEIRERLESHSTELLILTTADFLDLENTHLIVPVLVNTLASQTTPAYSYVILVNPSSTARTIEDLRGKNVLTSSRSAWNVAGMWLEVLLAREKLGRAASFFASVQATEKSQGCILPLFFGKVDACVVGEPDLNLAKEMNPQLGRLREVARSRPMIEGVIATPVEPTPGRKELIDAILGLNTDPRGRQVLELFKTERVVRIQPGDLDSARELYTDYRRLEPALAVSAKDSRPAEKGPAASQPAGR